MGCTDRMVFQVPALRRGPDSAYVPNPATAPPSMFRSPLGVREVLFSCSEYASYFSPRV